MRLYLGLTFWGEEYRRYFVDFCLASLLAPGFLADFNACPTLGSNQGPTVNGAPCTPVFSNSQAHLPGGLRTASKRRSRTF